MYEFFDDIYFVIWNREFVGYVEFVGNYDVVVIF